MFDQPPRTKLWHMLVPWKYYRSRWAKFVGTFCLVVITLEVVALLTGGIATWLWYSASLAMVILVFADMIYFFIDNRRYKRTRKTLDLWSQVIAGKVRMEDLTPQQQEDIAVQRALTYTPSKGTEHD